MYYKRKRHGPRLGAMIKRTSPRVKSPRMKSPRTRSPRVKSPNPGYTYEGDPIGRDRYASRSTGYTYEGDPISRDRYAPRKRPRRRRPGLRGRPKRRIVY